jgi:outer membrane lipoprotein SlyB
MRKLILAVSATAMALPATFAVPVDGAQAQRYSRYQSQRYSSYYDSDGYYTGRTWRGRDGRYYCRRPNGTTGLIVGGAAGALVGRAIDGGRNHTTGTIIGAVAGALAGREIERNSNNGGRRCR